MNVGIKHLDRMPDGILQNQYLMKIHTWMSYQKSYILWETLKQKLVNETQLQVTIIM